MEMIDRVRLMHVLVEMKFDAALQVYDKSMQDYDLFDKSRLLLSWFIKQIELYHTRYFIIPSLLSSLAAMQNW